MDRLKLAVSCAMMLGIIRCAVTRSVSHEKETGNGWAGWNVGFRNRLAPAGVRWIHPSPDHTRKGLR